MCVIIPTQSRAHENIFFRAYIYVVRARVCTVQSINASNPPESGKCTLYLYNNKYMRTCACLNTNSDRIPIQLIKMHVNGDSNFDDDGFCDYTRDTSVITGVVSSRPKKLVCARARTRTQNGLPEYYIFRS